MTFAVLTLAEIGLRLARAAARLHLIAGSGAFRVPARAAPRALRLTPGAPTLFTSIGRRVLSPCSTVTMSRLSRVAFRHQLTAAPSSGYPAAGERPVAYQPRRLGLSLSLP